MLPRFREFVRRTRARARARVGLAQLLVALARGGIDELWIGDSHAVLLNTSRFPFPVLAPADGHRWVWHLGPRVMFSIARNDFPPTMRRFAWVLRHVPAARRVSYVFSFGEIDIRCHLVPRLQQGEDLAFVATYVDRVRDLVGRIGAPEAVVVVPVPSGEEVFDHEAFPVAGSSDERVAAHQAVRERLTEATGDDQPGPKVRLLDLTPALSDPTGRIRPELTDDGCHTNDAGRDVTRREVDGFLLRA